MAKTQGHGNPDWSRDEVILALDLYLSCDGSIPSGSDPRVEALSKTLRELSVHPAGRRVGSFRDPDGVSFKLQNIRQVASGKGLANVSRVDREVWAAYGDKPTEVKQMAAAILALPPRKVRSTTKTRSRTSSRKVVCSRRTTAVVSDLPSCAKRYSQSAQRRARCVRCLRVGSA